MRASLPRAADYDEEQLVELLRRHVQPLPDLDDPAFADAFERFADARVVLIGEASRRTGRLRPSGAAG